MRRPIDLFVQPWTAMSNNEFQQRLQANREIDLYLIQHSLHAYRDRSDDAFALDAQGLRDRLNTICRGERAEVLKRMREIADDISSYELTSGGSANGHHERAAEAIRILAEELDPRQCPWAKLYPRFGGRSVLRALAQTLWKHNLGTRREWIVSTDSVAQDVWGSLSTKRSTLRSAVSRLAEWLESHGVIVEFSVNYSTKSGCINCKIVRVDRA
jgi:hypothetical protein